MEPTKKKIAEAAALSRLANLCAKAEYCVSDIRQKMARWDLPEGAEDRIVHRLLDERYIDEQRYACAFVRSKFRFNRWGRDKIVRGLRLKGISDDVKAKLAKIKNKEMREDGKKGDFVTRYCYSEEERLKAIQDLAPDPEITRFKGLGEISPEEFAGFIGPDMRLEQVTLHKNDQVQKLLEYYMGKNTMERQNFIIDNLVIEEDRPEEEYE